MNRWARVPLCLLVAVVVAALLPAGAARGARLAPVSLRAAAACAPKGTWPGPRGRAYLNEYASGGLDGKNRCGYYIAAHSFRTIVLGGGVTTMESAVSVDGTMTLPAGATLTGSFNLNGNTGLYVNGAFMAGPGSRITLTNDATSTIKGSMTLAHDAVLALYSAFTGPSLIVQGSLTVEGGGSILLPSGPECCGSGAQIQGTLNLLGTAAHPVRVTSGATPVNHWHTIEFGLRSHGTIANARVSYGGDNGCFTIDGGDVRVSNTTFTHCSGGGILVNGGTPNFANDTFADGGTPLRYSFLPENLLASGLRASGNVNVLGKVDYVAVGGAPNLYRGQGEWHNPGIPIVVGSMKIPVNMSMTIDAGTVITAAVTVSGGTLNLTGTAAMPVSIASGTQYANQVLEFDNGAGGTISHTVVHGAGGFNGVVVANASPTIVHSIIQRAVHGVVITGGAPVLSDDTFTRNTGNAVYFDGPSFPTTITTLTNLRATGNGDDHVVVGGDALKQSDYRGEGNWANPGLPIEVARTVKVVTGATLSFQAGVTILDDDCTGFQIQGVLNVAGAPGRPVTLQAQPGRNWGSLHFLPGSAGTIDHARLLSGGGGQCGALATVIADGAAPTISNTLIASSRITDVQVLHGGQPTLHGDSLLPPVLAGYYGVLDANSAAASPVDASHNWWGARSGPGKLGSGAAAASPGVRFTPWLAAAPGV